MHTWKLIVATAIVVGLAACTSASAGDDTDNGCPTVTTEHHGKYGKPHGETSTTKPEHHETTTTKPCVPPTTKPPRTTTTRPRTTTSRPTPNTQGVPTTARTTTTVSSSTTTAPPTPLPQVFSFNGVSPVCSGDVPFIQITFSNNFPQLDGHVGTLTFADVNGVFIQSQPLTFQSGATVRVLYPGATVDAAGNATDWPGWMLNANGLWVTDPSDAIWRDGLNLTYTVNPTATAFVTYPPETAACNSPENAPGPPGTPGAPALSNLPHTL